jgi:DNA repair protein RAD50
VELRSTLPHGRMLTRLHQASDKLNELKKQLKDISLMKQHAIHITRTQREAERLEEEISALETDLSATGSTKTADEVQIELDVLSGDMYDFRFFFQTQLPE